MCLEGVRGRHKAENGQEQGLVAPPQGPSGGEQGHSRVPSPGAHYTCFCHYTTSHAHAEYRGKHGPLSRNTFSFHAQRWDSDVMDDLKNEVEKIYLMPCARCCRLPEIYKVIRRQLHTQLHIWRENTDYSA